MKKIGLQIYTVRECLQDAAQAKAVLSEIKAFGYGEIELYGGDVDFMVQYARMAEESGLPICGAVSNMKHYQDVEKTVKFCRTFGISNICVSSAPVRTQEEAERYIAEVNALIWELQPHGITVSYHNHCGEFIRLENGRTFFDMLTAQCPAMGFTLDLYWAQRAGMDVRHCMDVLGERVDTLHLKDVRQVDEHTATFAPVGEGNLYWEGILAKAGEIGVKHYIVEQDSCEEAPVRCVGKSIAYLKAFQN